MYIDLLIVDLQLSLIFSQSFEKGKLDSISTYQQIDYFFEVGLCSKPMDLTAFFYVNEAKRASLSNNWPTVTP